MADGRARKGHAAPRSLVRPRRRLPRHLRRPAASRRGSHRHPTPRPADDLVQLSFLHVGRDHRGLGLGTELYQAAHRVAAEFGAKGLYVSATPSENTVDFYRRRGCHVTPDPDPELLALEPEDIHLECQRSPDLAPKDRP